ncbi:MAG: hypothetical protein AABX70_01650 [Nanoarchaeota archaeon]
MECKRTKIIFFSGIRTGHADHGGYEHENKKEAQGKSPSGASMKQVNRSEEKTKNANGHKSTI